ncbi:triose-phosphate isomerase [Brachyspira murdochii]|uniref:Triosephosphate isomerase n=2 Tax=Brachyspira murdochii TaxID=84378 RepID=D5U8F1_BRAM5|nr:triose-phosphate isomerase [Brachyspira murdochii]ADG70974.1 triosephosphate isomerase [Brachyspira murdochii DSM 12563]PPS22811.1 triosephosphate isomerase [Brachyspira murdochii]
MARRKLIAGNWKMNNSNKEALELVNQLKNLVKDVKDRDIMIAPTFTCLSDVHNAVKGSNIKLGAQNLYFEEKGAFTGQISADMLLAVGCEYVIVGHSECRDIFGEKDELINKKVKRALDKNLIPVLCVGEHLEEREKGITSDIVSSQTKEAFKGLSEAEAKKVVIAYEPVWAIGTGKTATPQDADEVHKTIRETLKSLYNESVAEGMIILYGGSVNEKNADDLLNMPNIDGALVGGASLVADKFARIVNYIAK